MSHAIIDKIEAEQFKKSVPTFNVGDTVKVHTRVREGEKERVQVFQGLVIARGGRGLNAHFTVRRISYGYGVERIFPLHSPRIEKVQVEREGKVRRAKLYYVRGRIGKDALTVKSAVNTGTRGATGRGGKKSKNKAAPAPAPAEETVEAAVE